MTAVVGIIDDQRIIIGADSCASRSSSKVSRKDEKVFRVKDYLIGIAGSFRAGNLLRYKLLSYLKKQKQKNNVSDLTFMNTVFIDAVKTCLYDGGIEYRNRGDQTSGLSIVGYRNNIYMIDYDYQIAVHHDNYIAIGSGAQTALGSLYSTDNKLNSKKRVLLALEAASKYSLGVEPPFVLKEMRLKNEV